MKIKFRLIASLYIVLATSVFAKAQTNSLGLFDGHKDIGKKTKPGSAVYDSSSQTYLIAGSGYNVWFDRDEFHFAYQPVTGDIDERLLAELRVVPDEIRAGRRK